MIRFGFPLLLLALQTYLFIRFVRWHRSMRKIHETLFAVIVGLFVLFNAAVVATMFVRLFAMRFSDGFVTWVIYPFLFWHVSTFLVAFALLVGAVIKLPFATLWKVFRYLPFTHRRAAAIEANPRVVRFDEARRRFLRRSMYGVTAASFAATGYGMIVGKEACDITEEELRVHGLPKEWDGFSIGLVTDIHSSIYMRKSEMDEYVRRLNDLGTDLIVVGGDMVNSAVDEVYPFAEAFNKLRAPMGVYGVLGNHDFYSGDPETVASVASEAGIRMLRDESVVLTRGGKPLVLLGIDDVGYPDVATKAVNRALRHSPAGVPRVLICHRPYFFKHAAALGMDVVLSGHTHGGQLVFGKLGSTAFTPAILASPYICGRYEIGRSTMYVSRGIGTVAIPVRINCPPELTRIVLRSA